MSIVVKMNMPDSCCECPCLRHDSIDLINAYQCNLSLRTFDDNDVSMWTKRAEDCPLSEIPETCVTCKYADRVDKCCDSCTDADSKWEPFWEGER